jgi:GMP synthase (glutamine-hydrolysing)
LHVLVFRHVAHEHLGTIAAALERCGIQPLYVDLPQNPDAPLAVASAAGLIIMGGPMSVNDDVPYMRQELRYVTQAVSYGKPVLGVCLGAQMIAKALGAPVYRNREKEIGWFPVDFTELAAADALFAGVGRREMVFQWHGETFDLPPGAELLATSPACRHQAFRLGSRIYGLQFHIETTPEMIASWLREDANCAAPEVTAPIDPFEHAARQGELGGLVFGRWCGMLKNS